MQDQYRATLRVYQQSQWQISDEQTSSDSESENGGSSIRLEPINIELAIRKIRTYTECLRDIGQSLENPALEESEDDEELSLFATNQRSAEDYHTECLKAMFPLAEIDLLQCLGRMSCDRYMRMKKERDLNARRQHYMRDSKSEFVDSGLGTSLPASYPASMLSRVSNMAGNKPVNIPPLSAEAKDGTPFDCVACGKLVRYTDNHNWRSVNSHFDGRES